MMSSASCSYFNKAFLFQATLSAQLYHTDSFLCNFIRAAFQLHCSWMSHQFRLPHHYISLPHNFISPTMVIASSFHVTQHVVAPSFHPPPHHMISPMFLHYLAWYFRFKLQPIIHSVTINNYDLCGTKIRLLHAKHHSESGFTYAMLFPEIIFWGRIPPLLELPLVHLF
jgi:hypothetical protein